MHSSYRGAEEWRKLDMPLTTGSNEACKLYDAIVTQYVGWYEDDSLGGMEGTLDKLKKADPNFVMGQVVANGLDILGTGRPIHTDEDMHEDIYKMVLLSQSTSGLTEREVKHVKAMDLWAHGFTDKASSIWEDILCSHPLDVLALKFAHDTYFYRGQSYPIRDSVARVLPHWNPAMPLYGYVLGMHSFGLEETNLYKEAEATARKALSINPRDGWSTHTLNHVMEMMGRQEEGILMMEKTQEYWKSCTMLACHNYWHWCLYYIELGDYETALSIFDDEASKRAASSGSMLDMVDVCSLLFRLQMEGIPIGDRWDKVYDVYKDHLHDHVLAFNDVHILIACLNAKQDSAVKELMTSIKTFVKEGQGDNKDVTLLVAEKLMEAFVAYDQGDYAEAVDLVNPVRYKIIEIGGSHAQRDLFNIFLIQAAIKSPKKEHHNLARNLLNERKTWKPKSPMTDRLMSTLLENHFD